jgi:PTS system ascorbate-specific IIC component
MKPVLDFIIFQLLDKAPVFLAIIAFIGLKVQRKSAGQIVDGVIKTVIGLLIIVVGAQTLLGAMGPIITTLNQAFGVKGVVPANEAAFALAMAKMANSITLTFIIGFVLHLVLVFIIPAKVFKNVYLTAHMMLFLSTFLNLTLPVVMGISGIPLLILSSVLCALYWTLTPAITRVVGRSFLGGDFTLGHHQQVGAFLASRVAPLFGKKEDDAEDLKLPKAIAIFRDNTISMTILMASVFLCIGIAAGHTAIIKVAGNDNWIIWLILRGFQFTAGIVVLLFGVRMFIGSIVPAFKGISERVIPKAVPALDCPTVYPYSPVGAMLGFLSSVVAAIVVTLILLVVRSSIIVFPSPIIMFFDGCTMGVFGNKFGGWRGALAAGFVTSFLAHLGCLFIYPLMGPIYGSGLMFSNIDFTLVWLPILYLLKFIAALFGHV